jgi:phosphatidylinositol-3-phosphatase
MVRSSSGGDETEGGDGPDRTIGEIVISPDAKGNGYTNNIRYTHSSDLLTMQEIFNTGPCIRDACKANDLSDLFKPGSIPGRITVNVREPM